MVTTVILYSWHMWESFTGLIHCVAGALTVVQCGPETMSTTTRLLLLLSHWVDRSIESGTATNSADLDLGRNLARDALEIWSCQQE
jgi:hypothetical protein